MNFSKTFLAGLLAFIVGNILIAVLWSLFVMGIVGALSATTGIDDNSILRIDLSENIVEAPPADPFAGVDFRTMTATPHVTLFEALRAIDAAKSDPRIKGIYIRPNGQGTVSMAVLEELRAAILDFKQESGKFVLAYNEAYGQGGYYLATAADGVYLQPEGLLDWHGMAVNTLFFKGLLDKLDLKVEVFRPTACKYKSAVEPYILTKLSDANREQLGQLVHSMWCVIAGDVAESRGLTIEMLDEYADELSVIQPEDALKKGMIDGLKYEDEMNDLFAEAGVEADGDGQYRFVSLGQYAAQVGPDMRHMGADRVAVLYADGQIVDGEGYDAVYGNTLAEKIRQLRLDEGVKAVVVRVNSPGGSALASDVIWREMELLKAEKPVIVSMGAYAASGGYYISAPADAIVADRLTLTGSIGVFGMLLDAGDAMERKLGVTVDAVKSNRSADLSIFRGLTPTERAMMLKSVDRVYETFTNLVAEGRNLPVEEVLDIAGGRVWSGVDALEIGLIDSYGGLKSAIAVAVDKAGLGEEYFIEEVREAPQGLAAILAALNAQVEAHVEHTELFDLYDEYRHVRNALSQQGVLTYCPYVFSFE